MTKDETRLAEDLRERIVKAMEGVFKRDDKIPFTDAAEQHMRALIETEIRSWSRDHDVRFPINTGLTAAECRRTFQCDQPTSDIPDDWEMWCEGWHVEPIAATPDDRASRNMRVNISPLNPSFRAPSGDLTTKTGIYR